MQEKFIQKLKEVKKGNIIIPIIGILLLFFLMFDALPKNPEEIEIVSDKTTIELDINSKLELDIVLSPSRAKKDNIIVNNSDEYIAKVSTKEKSENLIVYIEAEREGETTFLLSHKNISSNEIKIRIIDYARINRLKANAKIVMESIDELGEITLSSEKNINDVKKMYSLLDEEAKSYVTNLEELEKAEDLFKEHQNKVITKLMSEIDKIGEVTLEREEYIDSLNEQYRLLDSDLKLRIKNIDELRSAQRTIRTLKANEAYKKEAESVVEAIDNIGEVTLDSNETIFAARQFYESLSSDAKEHVSNFSVLSDAEYKLLELREADQKRVEQEKAEQQRKSSGTSEQGVLYTRTGSKYHIRKCGNGTYMPCSLSEAKSWGLTACKKCF